MRGKYLIAAAAIMLPGVLTAQTNDPEGRAQWTPSGIRWEAAPGVTVPGMQQATLAGDPAKSGRYTIRMRLPAGYKVSPHAYDSAREATVISGTLHFSYGDKPLPEGLAALPPGSFFVQPANVPFYFEARGPVELQISGDGPAKRPKFSNPQDEPK